ncbi:unnamed protein product [Ectocarpus sp. CCAP 1310/34]|nr:unnamed protein product [Ectocarpus sp. CCAP 1310/34]
MKRQQPAAPGRRHPSQEVARKEPRPRHHRKDEDGKEIPAPVAPALPASFPSLARSKSSAAEETAGAKFASLPPMVSRRGSSVTCSCRALRTMCCGAAEGWASAGVASDNRSPGGFDWIPSYVEVNATPLNDAPKALEAILMAAEQESVLTTDQTATTAAPRPAGRFAGQPPPSAALAPQEPMISQMLPSRASSPSVVFAQRSPGAGGGYRGGGESSDGLPIWAKISEDDEPIVVNVLPAASGSSSSSSSGMLQNSLGGTSYLKAADCGDGACNPISAWTPEPVVAGASALLVVLSDADFFSSVRSDTLTGMVPSSPPAAMPTLVADGFWHSEITATDGALSKNQRHYSHRQQQQQQQQQRLALAPPDIRGLIKELVGFIVA